MSSESTSSGPTGALAWFPFGQNDSPGWRLDVVTLLAVIGENSMAEHSQAITASFLCMLPRILPAPQALLKPSRPGRMPEVTAKMCGVYSGFVLDSVGFFANIIHPLDELPALSFKVLEIKHRDRDEAGGIIAQRGSANGALRARTGSGIGRLFGRRQNTNLSGRRPSIPRAPSNDSGSNNQEKNNRPGTMTTGHSTAYGNDVEQGGEEPIPGVTRRRTVQERVTDYLSNPTLANTAKRPAVPATLLSPVHILSIFSCLLSLAMFFTGIYFKDAAAMLAIGAISIMSSIVGYASWWSPILMNRTHTNRVPRSDVMVRTREGAFILIHCTEDVARELYFGTEECKYRVGERMYRLLMGVATILLMVSVVLLGNCTFWMQVFIGVSYMLLNGLYWGMGMLPRRLFWDLSRYEWRDVTPEDAKGAEGITDENDQREGMKSFTRTLWYAIRETKRTGWVERSGAAPGTKQWRRWLAEAEENALSGNRTWPSVGRKDEIMKEGLEEPPVPGEPRTDSAEQRAPLNEVQPPANSNQRQGGTL